LTVSQRDLVSGLQEFVPVLKKNEIWIYLWEHILNFFNPENFLTLEKGKTAERL